MGRIFITGDTHGRYDKHKINMFAKTHQDLTADDILIICGDFGCVWNQSATEMATRYWYSNQPWTTLFLAGNHENYKLLDKLPTYCYNGNNVKYVSSHLYYLPSGVYKFNSKKMLVIGGAESHDKEFRVKDVDWWEEELPTETQLRGLLQLIKENDNTFDLVLSHCAPDWVQEHYFRDYPHNWLTSFFEGIYFETSFSDWFCGHYHIDKDIALCDDKPIHILFDNIVEI